MEMTKNYIKATAEVPYRELLISELIRRKSVNPTYSQRAFARDLKVSTTTLCSVLAGKRHFSPRSVKSVAERLGLSPAQAQSMLLQSRGLSTQLLGEASFNVLADDAFSLIADWFHYGILNLAKLSDNHADPQWVAQRLGISILEAKSAIQRLERLGYLRVNGGRLERTVGTLDTALDRRTKLQALTKHHGQHLKLAGEALDGVDVQHREFNTMTIAINKSRLNDAKKMVNRFATRLANYLEAGDSPDDVYSLAIQLFPLTKHERI